MKIENIQFVLQDEEEKIYVTLDQYSDGVHLTIQDRKSNILSFSAKQTEDLAKVLSSGLTVQTVETPKVKHTHNQYGGMIDCQGCYPDKK